MKTWKILAPLGLAAAGTVAFLLTRRQTAGEKAAPAPTKAAPPANLKTGSYSFISGFQNASTVELQMDYDADKFSFAVVSEDYLSYSSDSHVALVEGEDFSLQLEYAYYGGEEADGRWSVQREKHPELELARYGKLELARYLEGDTVCFCIPIPEDACSYVLCTLFKAKGNDTPLAEMPDDPDLFALLSSISFNKV